MLIKGLGTVKILTNALQRPTPSVRVIKVYVQKKVLVQYCYLGIFFSLDKECKPIADIGFVIDSSGSIGRSNWARMKRFLKAMVSKLDVSPSATHISAVAYSNNPEVVLRFNNGQDTNDVNNAFDGMRWQRGFTFTDKAILLADSDLFQTANGMRPNVGKVRCFVNISFCYV